MNESGGTSGIGDTALSSGSLDGGVHGAHGMTREIAAVIEDEARLEALRRTCLLDSPPEEVFDRLTHMATVVLHVPVALRSLRDRDRHFCKSQGGLGEPLATLRQTPLTYSFCKHAVGSREPFMVADARIHPLFADQPRFSGPGATAYAGIPLITSEGHALGTFCVVDEKPHEWTEKEVGTLRVLAKCAMSEIELRSRVDDLRDLTANLQEIVETRTSALRASEERQRVLLDVNNAIVTYRDRDPLFAAIATALRRVIPFDRCALVLHDPVRNVFKVLGVAGSVPSPPVIPIGTEWPKDGSRSGWILDHRAPLLTMDLRDPPSFVEHPLLLEEGLRSAVSVPLTTKGKVLGTLNVASRVPGHYGEDVASLLAAIGEQVALAIENLLAYEEIAALKTRLEEENLYLQEEVRTEAAFGDVVGESPAILGVLANV